MGRRRTCSAMASDMGPDCPDCGSRNTILASVPPISMPKSMPSGRSLAAAAAVASCAPCCSCEAAMQSKDFERLSSLRSGRCKEDCVRHTLGRSGASVAASPAWGRGESRTTDSALCALSLSPALLAMLCPLLLRDSSWTSPSAAGGRKEQPRPAIADKERRRKGKLPSLLDPAPFDFSLRNSGFDRHHSTKKRRKTSKVLVWSGGVRGRAVQTRDVVDDVAD